MKNEIKEHLYLVDNESYLHLKDEGNDGISYAGYDKVSGEKQGIGLITYENMLESPIRNPVACARVLAIQELGLEGTVVSEVALQMLEKVKDARREFFKAHADDLSKKNIRFINSNYEEQFRIPDGGKIQVDFPAGSFVAPCEYIDDYHTRIGGDVFHICQFAEFLESGGGTASPEPVTTKDEAAWRIGGKEHLSIHSTDDGWDFSIYDKNFSEIDGGQIDLKSITIQECRDMILEDRGLQNRTFMELDYDMVEDRAADMAEEHLNSVLDQLKEKRQKSAEKTVESGECAMVSKRKLEACL